MTNDELIAQLQAERHRIDAVIKLLSGSHTTAIAHIKATKGARKRKKMSAETRKKMAEAQKKRWADAKKDGA
jgi:hypothetical protein